ncbi:MAG TPA: PEPxxWA-CTERM sorting domain-containing protein [Caulobacteraceae bacterium]|jgi:hypothetical protein|nr:PEPxxWA-CTERM sorting domain-containing protein [Caulobacteraceae bacterium]
MRHLKQILAGSILAAAAAGAAQAASYDAVTGFSSPGSIWSYSAAGTALTDLVSPPNGLGNLPFLWNQGAVPYSVTLSQNATSSEVDFETIRAAPNSLSLDPESLANVAVTFTAPSAGRYTFSSVFTGDDVGEHTHGVEVDVNGSSAFTDTIASFGATASFGEAVTLTKGDTISFLVDGGSLDNCGFCNLSTGLTATISAVPEPETWAMMLVGFGGMGAAMRSTRRRQFQ